MLTVDSVQCHDSSKCTFFSVMLNPDFWSVRSLLDGTPNNSIPWTYMYSYCNSKVFFRNIPFCQPISFEPHIAVQLANLWVVHCFLQDVAVSLTWRNFKANEIRESWCNDLIRTSTHIFLVKSKGLTIMPKHYFPYMFIIWLIIYSFFDISFYFKIKCIHIITFYNRIYFQYYFNRYWLNLIKN